MDDCLFGSDKLNGIIKLKKSIFSINFKPYDIIFSNLKNLIVLENTIIWQFFQKYVFSIY